MNLNLHELAVRLWPVALLAIVMGAGLAVLAGHGSGRDPVFLPKPLQHDTHPGWRILPRQVYRLGCRTAEPSLAVALGGQQHRHALMVDGGDQWIGCRRQKGVGLKVDARAVFLE